MGVELNPRLAYSAIMKLKFIFKTVWRCRGLILALWLVAALFAGLPAVAQQGADPSPPPRSSPIPVVVPPSDEADPPADPPSDESVETMFPHFKDTRFWLSGQMNFIFQTHPPFPAAYSGPHSLSPHYEKATSRVLTLYTGVRLNTSTEILADVEEAGGTALSLGFGLAG